MNEADGPADAADLERLASRLAMLASAEGEADNAGRAVGAMARRIGLTGGDLKRIFLAGAAGLAPGGERDRLRAEVATLQQNLNGLDEDARRALGERDALRQENGRLQSSLERLRAQVRTWGLAGAGAATLLLVVGLTAWGMHSHSAAMPPPRAAGRGFAACRRGAPGRRPALPGARSRAACRWPPCPAASASRCCRLVWKELFQWAEVQAPGGWTGYVLTTEIDLS